MNPLFFWSLAPSRSRPPRRVPLRRLRRFFVPISSDYDRFELPRIIENPAESESIEGGGGVGFKEREREREKGIFPFYRCSCGNFDDGGGLSCILWDENGRIFTRTRVTRNLPPLSQHFSLGYCFGGGFSRVPLIPQSRRRNDSSRGLFVWLILSKRGCCDE